MLMLLSINITYGWNAEIETQVEGVFGDREIEFTYYKPFYSYCPICSVVFYNDDDSENHEFEVGHSGSYQDYNETTIKQKDNQISRITYQGTTGKIQLINQPNDYVIKCMINDKEIPIQYEENGTPYIIFNKADLTHITIIHQHIEIPPTNVQTNICFNYILFGLSSIIVVICFVIQLKNKYTIKN